LLHHRCLRSSPKTLGREIAKTRFRNRSQKSTKINLIL